MYLCILFNTLSSYYLQEQQSKILDYLQQREKSAKYAAGPSNPQKRSLSADEPLGSQTIKGKRRRNTVVHGEPVSKYDLAHRVDPKRLKKQYIFFRRMWLKNTEVLTMV